MTDAAVSVTQSAVERFTEQYLRSLGCGIEMYEDRWDVTVPDGADTTLSTGNLTLVLADDTDGEDAAEPLHPESALFQQILSEASERCPTGKLSIGFEGTTIEIPPWLQHNNVEVQEAKFTPYYDRTAVAFLFQVGIETVSEYQKELLRAIAIDARSGEYLPELAETFLQITTLDGDSAASSQSSLTKSDVSPLLETARSQLVDQIQAEVDEIHQEASRAADAEVEEYRQMQQQRIEELEEKHSHLSTKVDEVSETINSGKQGERVQALKARKQIKSEYEDISAELNELRERRDQGFPQRQQEIRERHALTVKVTPLAITEVEYERGEVEFTLAEKETVRTITTGFSMGIGMTEDITCTSCDRTLSNQNPLQTIEDGLYCGNCM